MPNRFTGKQDLYLEIASRYEQYIKLGVLKSGEKLPSVRVAAGELGVNPNTVQKAYQHLEENGLLITLPKKGVYVQETAEKSDPCEHSEIAGVLIGLKEKGIPYETLMQMIKEIYDL